MQGLEYFFDGVGIPGRFDLGMKLEVAPVGGNP